MFFHSFTTMLILLIVCSFLNQAFSSSLDPINFSFPSFDTESCSESGELICSGSAAAGNGYVNITPGSQQTNGTVPLLPRNNYGRVLYRYRVLAWPASISTTFIVRISKDPNTNGSGDGMAFVMAQDDSPSPSNSYGGFLGLFNQTTEGGKIKQLAVELDTYYNEFDPDDNHVGIDTTSIKSVATVSLSSLGIDLKHGRDVKVKINYDGLGKKLQVSVAYAGSPLISVLNHTIEMSKIVPSSVYVGFTGSTGSASETHQILSWYFTSVQLPESSLNNGSNNTKKIKDILIIIFPIITCGLLLGICIFLVVKACRGKSANNLKNEDIESRSRTAANAPKMFTLKQLSMATNNFCHQNLLGAGGFGSVYRGVILDPPSSIAVKKISATSKQGEREYLAEICTIGRLRHKNLVQLQGWCHERDHLLLVYEFMPNGSLDRFISKGFLDWDTRYRILTGLASALLYLHEECGTTVVHRDVKPNNVMLDSEYNAHLGDFGLARLHHNEGSVITMLAGTPGYLAPECTYTGKATPESDVFSFGIVVLEVSCGRRCMGSFEENSLVDHVWNLHGKDELLNCVDQKLQNNLKEEEMKRALVVGLACSHPDPMLRPSIRKVVQVFMNPNEPLLDLPKSRPNAIYIPISSSSPCITNGLSSLVASGSGSGSGSCSASTIQDETTVQYGR